ncbi:MAG TPA: DUF1572 family protein [Candidatus Angelobacter sp.]|nr:DUF1572 family protein [Candidatus Angelobacter sp.]
MAFRVATLRAALHDNYREKEMPDFGAMFLDEALRNFQGIKRHADAAMDQLNDEQFFAMLDAEANSVAILVKHVAGNLLSRFTDFLTSDGEKPNRERDKEFIVAAEASRTAIMETWAKGWQLLLDTVQSLHPDDLARQITIRSEPHTVMQAITRQIAHHASHVGQIVMLAKHWKGTEWKTLSVPRGQSDAFNAAFAAKFKSN